MNPSTPKPKQPQKAFTSAGKPVAAFTLRVKFKPEHILPDSNTGEIREGVYTYRCDLEEEKLQRKWQLSLAKPTHYLIRLLRDNKHKYQEATLYDNRKPANDQCVIIYTNGIYIHPAPGTDAHKRLMDLMKQLP